MMTAACMPSTIVATQYSRKYCIVDLGLDIPSNHIPSQPVQGPVNYFRNRKNLETDAGFTKSL